MTVKTKTWIWTYVCCALSGYLLGMIAAILF
jgi:hypothetical protein